jgi:hypothetical protein
MDVELYSLTIRVEHTSRMFESKVLRRMFEPKREEVTGEWIKLHNEELHDLYSSPSIIRVIKLKRMRCAGHVAYMGEMRNSYTILVEYLMRRGHLVEIRQIGDLY